MLYKNIPESERKCKCSWLSCVWPVETPSTVSHQAPLSMESSRQEYWSGLPFSSPRDLPDPGSNLGLLHHRQILYHLSHQGRVLELKSNDMAWAQIQTYMWFWANHRIFLNSSSFYLFCLPPKGIIETKWGSEYVCVHVSTINHFIY